MEVDVQQQQVVQERPDASPAEEEQQNIRRVAWSDRAPLCALLNQLSSTGKLSDEEMEGFFANISTSSTHQVFGVEQNGKLVAAATLLVERKLLHGAKSVGHIEDVVVDKECRGRGTGKLLIQFLVSLARDQGCYKVILDCAEHNVRFYERCGLERHGVEMSVYFSG